MKQASSSQVDPPPLPHRRRPPHTQVLRIELPRGRGRGKGVVREGGGEEEEDEIRELEERVEKAGLPEHALKAAQKELKV